MLDYLQKIVQTYQYLVEFTKKLSERSEYTTTFWAQDAGKHRNPWGVKRTLKFLTTRSQI